MGIRIHKVVGYGLTDVKTRKYRIADGRLNQKSPLLDYDSDVTPDDYIDWLVARRDELMAEHPDDWYMHSLSTDLWADRERKEEAHFSWRERYRIHELVDLMHYNPEYGMKNVLCIRPLACPDWSRYDDPIDWLEETHRWEPEGEDGAGHVRVLSDGIHPWSGLWMDARDGRALNARDNKIDPVWLRRMINDERFKLSFDANKLAKVHGFANFEDAKQNMVPRVPNEIRELVTFAELFKNPDDWRLLRPMIYTYWS